MADDDTTDETHLHSHVSITGTLTPDNAVSEAEFRQDVEAVREHRGVEHAAAVFGADALESETADYRSATTNGEYVDHWKNQYTFTVDTGIQGVKIGTVKSRYTLYRSRTVDEEWVMKTFHEIDTVDFPPYEAVVDGFRARVDVTDGDAVVAEMTPQGTVPATGGTRLELSLPGIAVSSDLTGDGGRITQDYDRTQLGEAGQAAVKMLGETEGVATVSMLVGIESPTQPSFRYHSHAHGRTPPAVW